MPPITANQLDPDLALAKSVARGEITALEYFFAAYADPLFAFIHTHLDAPRAEIEEIWQETLVASLHSIETFDGRSQLFTWLCSLARHKVADFCRRKGRQNSLLADTPVEDLESLIDNAPLPEEVLKNRHTRLVVLEVLGNLPLEYRQALIIRYAEGCSVAELAQRLGKSYKATEALLMRAKSAFRRKLAAIEGVELERQIS
jgi:RNA polymerase sigma-70 factor (ECF subfamily)